MAASLVLASACSSSVVHCCAGKGGGGGGEKANAVRRVPPQKAGMSAVAHCSELSLAAATFGTVSHPRLASQWSWMGSTGGRVTPLSKTAVWQRPVCIISPSRSRWRAELQSETDVEDSLGGNPLRLNSSSGGDQQTVSGSDTGDSLVGEDSGVFDFNEQKTSSWINFTLVLGVVLAILYVFWLEPRTGYGGAFVDALSSLNSNHEVVMLEILFIFALVHSGGASLRAAGEKVIGERAYRVLFAGVSLPLAVSAVVYFINHRYDGYQLWQFRTVPGVHELCWAISFISFLFLYPSTFNLLEVAAVDKPKVHMYETGIMRITRHPQMVGQALWCLAHTLWIGNSFTLITSLGLLAHHLFGVWHGDQRLAAKYGEAFEVVKKRTSVIPFAAIVEGRQELPPAYYKEFLRLPYYVIVGLTIGTYVSHPLMQIGSHWLHW